MKKFLKFTLGLVTIGALVSAPVLTASPVQAVITDKCTTTIGFPKKIKISSDYQPFEVKTSGGTDCLDSVTVELRKASNDTWLDDWQLRASNLGYQSGSYQLKAGKWKNAGKYKTILKSSKLNYSWASKNGLDSWDDYPTVKFSNTSVDVRFASKTKFDAKRTINGVELSGTANRYFVQDYWNGSYEPQSKAKVRIQQKVKGKWVTKKTVTASKTGKFKTTFKTSKKGTWRAQIVQAPNYWSSNSKSITIAKKSSGKAKTKISRKLNHAYYPDAVTGKVRFNAGDGFEAAPKGTKVLAQKRQKGKWVTKKTLKTNSKGEYTFKNSKSGKYRFVVKSTSKYQGKTSAAVTFK